MHKLLLSIILFAIATHRTVADNRYIGSSQDSTGTWSMILLPDPQTYISFARNQPIFELMTAWIADNQDRYNIGMTLCTGDLVYQNQLLNPELWQRGDQTSTQQWRSVSKAFERLDQKMPYYLALGNHDYGYTNAENRHTQYNDYFPIERNLYNTMSIREVGPDVDGRPSMANALFEFRAPGGIDYLVLNMEFAPRDQVLEWAQKTLALPLYRDHRVIVLTHSFLDAAGQRFQTENYQIEGNYGQQIWEKLIYDSPNICLVLAGHIQGHEARDHVSHRSDPNSAGRMVHQLVFNAQALGGGRLGNGGDGWLRILQFSNDGNTLHVKTYSPLFGASPVTRQYAWRMEDFDDFTLELDR